MSEDVARAVGAASPRTVTIAGKECRLRPLGIRELTELERECLRQYRRQYVQTYADMADMLPDGAALIRKKVDEAAGFTVQTLPEKRSYLTGDVQVDQKILDWAENEHPGLGLHRLSSKEAKDNAVRNVLASSLDSGILNEEEYTNLTGKKPVCQKIGYVGWWLTGSINGMVEVLYTVFRDSGVTRDQIMDELGQNPALLADLSRDIEHLSVPDTKNG